MLFFLKLGGSLITEKDKPYTAREDILRQIAAEIKQARQEFPEMQLLLGHGSGSFGHVSAKKYKTRDGVETPVEWQGFQNVWRDARKLNQIVIETFSDYCLPVIAFPPSSAIICSDHQVKSWDIQPIQKALKSGLIPLVYGDVIFDETLGGTILSTEELFFDLAPHLNPDKILLAGKEKGVWEDFPQRTKLIKLINKKNLSQIKDSLKGSEYTDVTGGMLEKVSSMLQILENLPQTEILIFSGEHKGEMLQTLSGCNPGTLISSC